MKLSICSIDSSFYVSEAIVRWAVQAIDNFCGDVSEKDIKDAGLVPSTALGYYARNTPYDDSGKITKYTFNKDCIKKDRRKRIPNSANINTFSSWCRRSGLLFDQRGLFGLSELATLLLKPNKITIKEFAFVLLSKQWVRIDGDCHLPFLSVLDKLISQDDSFLNLLRKYAQGDNEESKKNQKELQHLFFKAATGRDISSDDSVSFTRFDTLRNCLSQAGILSDKDGGFRLTDNGKKVLEDYHNNDSRIKAFPTKEKDIAFYEYMCAIMPGAISLIKKDNVNIYMPLYPNLSNLALLFESDETTCDSGLKSIMEEEPQLIYYGAPGTGKSFKLEKEMEGKRYIRTIFHPDSDYASFIGCYKPVTDPASKQIEYRFRPQAFIRAYVEAWISNQPFYLIIEEINRGNCAQIFGDIFQLLDRKSGISNYKIYPDIDLSNHLKEEFSKHDKELISNGITIPQEIKEGKVMWLPNNLFIRATMNTSDQSLFPMDSAFKRRWAWKYFAIKDEGKGYTIALVNGKKYDWWTTISKLNEKVFALTKSSDKQIGYWFAKVPKGETTIKGVDFISKVIFYLWNDVFKDYTLGDNNAFTDKIKFDSFYNSDGSVNEYTLEAFMSHNNIEAITPAASVGTVADTNQGKDSSDQ